MPRAERANLRNWNLPVAVNEPCGDAERCAQLNPYPIQYCSKVEIFSAFDINGAGCGWKRRANPAGMIQLSAE